jgi:hypothetical protein
LRGSLKGFKSFDYLGEVRKKVRQSSVDYYWHVVVEDTGTEFNLHIRVELNSVGLPDAVVFERNCLPDDDSSGYQFYGHFDIAAGEFVRSQYMKEYLAGNQQDFQITYLKRQDDGSWRGFRHGLTDDAEVHRSVFVAEQDKAIAVELYGGGSGGIAVRDADSLYLASDNLSQVGGYEADNATEFNLLDDDYVYYYAKYLTLANASDELRWDPGSDVGSKADDTLEFYDADQGAEGAVVDSVDLRARETFRFKPDTGATADYAAPFLRIEGTKLRNTTDSGGDYFSFPKGYAALEDLEAAAWDYYNQTVKNPHAKIESILNSDRVPEAEDSDFPS